MVSPIFFIFLLLSVRLISCDALCHVVLEVLVEERVVVFMEAGRSEIIGHIGYGTVPAIPTKGLFFVFSYAIRRVKNRK